MNRRDFLKLAAAAVASRAAPALPIPAEPEAQGGFFTIDAIRRAIETLQANHVPAAPAGYTILAHPSLADELAAVTCVKARWKLAYRQARVDLREWGAQISKGLRENGGAIGRIESVRFVSSDGLSA